MITENNIPDYYTILEVTQNASLEEIKKSYRRLALKYHPDVNKNNNDSSYFIKINEAYEILSNDQKRKFYDQLFNSSFQKNNYKDFFDWVDHARQKAYNYSKMSFDDFVKILNISRLIAALIISSPILILIYGSVFFCIFVIPILAFINAKYMASIFWLIFGIIIFYSSKKIFIK